MTVRTPLPLAAGFAVALGLPLAAQDEEAQLRETHQCQGCTLENPRLADQDLTSVDLSESSVKNADFRRANLFLASFDGADLEGADFREANLRGATFEASRLRDVKLEGADLTGARFKDAQIDETELAKATVCNTVLPDGSTLSDDC